jgi:hypothetical protein
MTAGHRWQGIDRELAELWQGKRRPEEDGLVSLR